MGHSSFVTSLFRAFVIHASLMASVGGRRLADPDGCRGTELPFRRGSKAGYNGHPQRQFSRLFGRIFDER